MGINTVPIQQLNATQNLTGFGQTQQARVNQLLSLFDYSKRFKYTHHGRWKKNYEYYHSIDQQIMNRADHQSKIFVPRPYLVVETKTPRMVTGILSKDPMFTINPVSSDDIVRARIAQEILTKQWKSQDNVILNMTNWFKDSFIYGGAIGKTGWEYRQELTPERTTGAPFLDPISLQLVQPEVIEEQWTVTVDRPFFKNIDISEFYPDPTASTIEDCKFCVHKYNVPRHQLKQLENIGVYTQVDAIPQINNISTHGGDDFSQRQISVHNLSSTNTNDITNFNDPVYEMVEILEFWWIDGDRKMKTVIANRTTVIQDIPIPYWHRRWPFYLLKDTPMTNEFWGMGEIDPIMGLCAELNDMRNAQADNRNQFLKAFWVVNRHGNVDVDQLENMPAGGILEVTGNPSQALEVLRPPQLDTMSMGGQQQIDSDIQMTSGANDVAIGQSTRSQVRTATMGSLLAESTNTRFALTGLLYLEQMRKVGRDWLALNQQFMSQTEAVRVLGQDGMNMQDISASAADIPKQYDLFVTLGSELQGDQDLIKQQSLQLFQLMANVPGYQITEGAKDLMQKFGEKNADRFFEGSQVVPTYEILNQLGVGSGGTQSNFGVQSAHQAEVAGGMQGGQEPNINAAINRSDTLQTAKNTGVTPNVA